jgi:fibronectin type 3 domain-containing protein
MPALEPGAPPPVKFTWDAPTCPQGVRYYNVYRGVQPQFEARVETRIGSPNEPAFIDCGLAAGTYYYRVTAVDAWGNESAPSESFTHRAERPAPSRGSR